MITEITTQKLNTEQFISEKVMEIKDAVGDGMAINALSGIPESEYKQAMIAIADFAVRRRS